MSTQVIVDPRKFLLLCQHYCFYGNLCNMTTYLFMACQICRPLGCVSHKKVNLKRRLCHALSE